MAEQSATGEQKQQKVASKSFMTAGPTLHYSHSNVITFWFFSIIVFGIVCLFWAKMCSGKFWSYDINTIFSFQHWQLGQIVTEGLSVFEYPWQILVLGLLMALIAVEPVLVSQLMSFRYSLPFVAEVFFLANMPGFAMAVLLSCFAVAIRPLRFRSRFASIALCITPQLFYWGFFARVKGTDPLVWGFSYTPWICAWLLALCIAGAVVGIGHFTRYRPGLVFTSTAVILVLTTILFNLTVGFNELDYQLYVVKNNPEQLEQFHAHSISESLDNTLADKAVVERLLKVYFYPEEPNALREVLKREIVERLSYGNWPSWFKPTEELKFPEQKVKILGDLDKFIQTRIQSRRMPIALYFKAILNEYSPDLSAVQDKEMLSFYNDYPSEDAFGTWVRLYEDYPNSPEAIEARWRIAKRWAGLGKFTEARNILGQAINSVKEKLSETDIKQEQADTIFSIFKATPDTAMTAFKLTELQVRLFGLQTLCSQENLDVGRSAGQILSQFVMLNPHSRDYSSRLEELLRQTKRDDGLYDNILLAQILIIPDSQIRMSRLLDLNTRYKKRDAGIQSLYEVGLLKKQLWLEDKDNTEKKKKLLTETRDVLTSFLSLYPDSFYADSVKKVLAGLPKPE